MKKGQRLVIVGPRLTGIVEDHLFRVDGAISVETSPRFQIREGEKVVWSTDKEVRLDGKRVRGLSEEDIEALVEALRGEGWEEGIHQGGTLGWALKALKALKEAVFVEVLLLGFIHEAFILPQGKWRLAGEEWKVEAKRVNVALLPREGVWVDGLYFPQLIISSPKDRELAGEEWRKIKDISPSLDGWVLLTMGSDLPPGNFRFSVYDPNRKMKGGDVEEVFERDRVVLVVNKLEMANGSYPYPPKGSFMVMKEGSLQSGYDVMLFGSSEMVKLTLPVREGIGPYHLGKGDRFSTFLTAKLAERRAFTIEEVRDSVVIAHDRLMEVLEE